MSSRSSSEGKTGLFHQKSTGDFVMLWHGREICRYPTVDAFIEAHEAGLKALDLNQADLLARYYRDL